MAMTGNQGLGFSAGFEVQDGAGLRQGGFQAVCVDAG